MAAEHWWPRIESAHSCGKIHRLGQVPVSLSLEGAWLCVRPDSSPEWLICLELTVILKTFRSPR
jgi:hypothetical protein